MIGLIGLDHRNTSASVRGRLTFADERLRGALSALTTDAGIREAVILSTCNRVEFYIAADDLAPAFARVERFIGESFRHGASAVDLRVPPTNGAVDAPNGAHDDDSTFELPSELQRGMYTYTEADAAAHLFRVAAGLRSLVIGEPQILGQVKEALAAAEAEHCVGDELRSLFTSAIKVGKRARAETAIGRADVSIAALAIRVATESLGGLAGKSALLLGAGRTSRLCAQLARANGIERLVLANRSLAAATELAAEVQGEAITLAHVAEAIPSVQLVIGATAAPHTVLSASTVSRGMAGRRAPLVVLDLAMPPDVEEAVGLLPSVSLYTLDTLRGMDTLEQGEVADERAEEIVLAEEIVDEGMREFKRGRALRLAVPSIAALRQHVDRSQEAELLRALAQLATLSDDERAVITRFGQRLVDKMFFHLVSRIRSLAEFDEVPPEVTMRVLARLFADPADPPAQQAPMRDSTADPTRAE